MNASTHQEREREYRAKRMGLWMLCAAVLVISANASIVNIAVPSIGQDLGFSNASLVWIANAYLVSFGGLLLVCGRCGDVFGHRRVLCAGAGIFAGASLWAALGSSPTMFVGARAAQGVGAAMIWANALSLINHLFEEPALRAKAMGRCAFVIASGAIIGVLIGGVVTGAFHWRWIFIVNAPLGIVVGVLLLVTLSTDGPMRTGERIDVLGGTAITLGLSLAVYAIVASQAVGGASARTWVLLGAALAFLALFVGRQSRAARPLIPLALFRSRALSIVSVAGLLLSAAVLTWSFVSALYLQLVLGATPMQVGLAFVPANIATSVTALLLSPALVMHLGSRRTIVLGMLLTAAGLAVLSQGAASASVWHTVLPAMVLVGVGYGLTYNAMLLSALEGIAIDHSGAASGIVTTSFTVGGTLGLSILVAMASAHTQTLTGVAPPIDALHRGYQLAFGLGAGCAVLAALISELLPSPRKNSLPLLCNRSGLQSGDPSNRHWE